MINVTIKLSPSQEGKPDYIVVQGHSTKCPGVALTHPLSYWHNDEPAFNNKVWVMTHIASGYEFGNPIAHIQDARAIAKCLTESGLDWTKPIDYIKANYHQYRAAILQAQSGML